MIFAHLGERIIERICFHGKKGGAVKCARVYAPAGN